MPLSNPIFLGLGEIVITLVVIFALLVVVRVYIPTAPRHVQNLVHAVLFGGGVIYCTAFPVALTPGVIADPRGALLTLAGLQAGPLVGGLTLLAAEVHRAILGGSGIYAGLIGNALASGVGLAGWWWKTHRLATRRLPGPILLACALGVTATTMLAFVFVRPFSTGVDLLQRAGPALALVQFGSVLFLGSLLRLDFEARESRRQLQFQQDALDAHALVARLDRQGTVYHVNRNLRWLSGDDAGGLSDDLTRLFGAARDGTDLLPAVWPRLIRGETWHGEIHNTARSGETYCVEATIIPFVAPHGRVEHIIFIGTDVSERVRTAEALVEAKRAAESASRSKSEFLANMSHELRTPLNAIMGFADILRREVFGPLGNDRYREYAGDIAEAAGYLYNLISDILDISRIETGSITITPEAIAVADVARSATRLVQQRATNKNIGLSALIPTDTPPIHADPAHVKQIFTNLLTNGVKYTEAGGRVWIAVDATTPMSVVIGIHDTGQGIPVDKLEHIKEPFVQANRTAGQSSEGVGLGLFLVKRLVDINQGRIDITSAPGEGTVVRITLPRADAVDAAA
jgi:signal transduction histidine kinase